MQPYRLCPHCRHTVCPVGRAACWECMVEQIEKRTHERKADPGTDRHRYGRYPEEDNPGEHNAVRVLEEA